MLSTSSEIENKQDIVEEKRVYTDSKDYPISTIRDMCNDGDIILQPEYQRDYVMDDKKASKLIESILLQIPIPTIYLCEESDNSLSVIDGQQRITSITRFLYNDFKLSGLEELQDLNGKYFKELEKDNQRLIKQTTIHSIVISKKSQELKYEIFARLNQGSTKLKPQELRNCIYRGPFNKMIESIAKGNSTLPILFHEENKRKQYQEYILRFFALRDFNNYASSLKKTMNLYKLFNSKIDIVKQIFGNNAFCSYDRQNNVLTNKFSGSIYDSLMVACSLFDNHSLMVHADELRTNFEDVKINNSEYQDYTYAGTGSKSRVIGRIMFIYNLFNDIIGGNNSQRRAFTLDEKLELWNNSNHICPYCNQQILNIDDAEVDHVIAYSNGGETIIGNAQLLHRHCNRKKNNFSNVDCVNFEDDEE